MGRNLDSGKFLIAAGTYEVKGRFGSIAMNAKILTIVEW